MSRPLFLIPAPPVSARLHPRRIKRGSRDPTPAVRSGPELLLGLLDGILELFEDFPQVRLRQAEGVPGPGIDLGDEAVARIPDAPAFTITSAVWTMAVSRDAREEPWGR